MNTKTTLAIVGMAAEIALVISPSLVTNASAKITQRLRRRNAFNPKVVRQMWERPPVLVSLRLKVSDMSSYKKRPAGIIHLVLQAVRLDRTNTNIHLLSFFLFSFNLISHTLFYHYHTIGDFKIVTLIE
jgi:hypothetical protein